MPAVLSLADVDRIAALAHLELTADERQLFRKQLADILAYAEQVRRIDTTGVPATTHIDSTHPTERADEPRPSLPVADALDAAPEADRQAGLFRVPRVIGG
ncbi:MAG: Asp-tRNA(Asn)/Glu-tRNA(Gln) amidotransferase subunit GatC [Vicinamibacterales bacterium]